MAERHRENGSVQGKDMRKNYCTEIFVTHMIPKQPHKTTGLQHCAIVGRSSPRSV
jgi:hypothetical protein